MRKLTIATAVLGVAATLLTSVGATSSGATAGYDARAHLPGHRTCEKTDDVGLTRRALVLDNRHSAHPVQFKVVREGDPRARPVRYVWVRAHHQRSLTVTVAQRSTVSVRVRVPEMGRHNLRLSATVRALKRCYVETVAPRAALGGVFCHGADSVAQVVLDNRGTSDRRIRYQVASTYGHASASYKVRPESALRHYVPVPAGGSTHVTVEAAGERVLAVDAGSVSCP